MKSEGWKWEKPTRIKQVGIIKYRIITSKDKILGTKRIKHLAHLL